MSNAAPAQPIEPPAWHALHRARPRSRFARASLWAFAGLLVASFVVADVDWSEFLGDDVGRHMSRFGREIRPKPLRDAPWDWGTAFSWAGERIREDNALGAAGATLALSVLAVVLAALLGGALAPFAARNLMAPSPFSRSEAGHGGWARLPGALVVGGTRFALVLLRCLPEYVLAFLLLAVFGLTAWPAVLALAIHNAGVLGRLGAETIENVAPRPPRALWGLGATRGSIAAVAVFPTVLPRGLLYVFYRWETCVREATVLGLLNIPSLGLLIDEAQVRSRKDDLLLYVLMAAALVLLGDLASSALRRVVRRA